MNAINFFFFNSSGGRGAEERAHTKTTQRSCREDQSLTTAPWRGDSKPLTTCNSTKEFNLEAATGTCYVPAHVTKNVFEFKLDQ